jgi:transcriptional regulator with XRE-family HTH domain
MARDEPLSARVSARLRELSDRRGFRSALAGRLKLSPAAISPYVSGEREVTLDMLEAMAELSQVPVAELVAPPGSLVKQLDAHEATLLRYVRKWPSSVVQALLGFLAYVADEPAVETQARNLCEYWRHLPQGDRDWLYGLVVGLREDRVPQDLREGLTDRLKREQYKRQSDDAGRRRKDA